MSSLEHLEKEYFEELFDMHGGYVLGFTNSSFERFFRTTVDIEIYEDPYGDYGNSKANRLRYFWDNQSDDVVGVVLSEMLDLWEFSQHKKGKDPEEDKFYTKCRDITKRLLNGEESATTSEAEFLQKNFGDVSFDKINIDEEVKIVLEIRIKEAQKTLDAGAPLSTIFLCGSILEGLLLGLAQNHPQEFNECDIRPKNKQDKVKKFNYWTLSEFIDVAYKLDVLKLDVHKFSHYLRDFRNYIHPYEQVASGFSPDEETAKICLQVLRAAIISINKYQW